MAGETRQTDAGAIGAVVFGSDQGLVGQFNDVVADYAVKTLAALPANPESGPSVSAFMRAWRTRACR
jgi:F0F1-type ATP synthase gamma subunit